MNDSLPGLLFVFVGPAGSGKNTIINRVMEHFPQIGRLPTATTRPPREGEREGVDHFFVSLEAFHAMREAGQLLEYQQVHQTDYYGTVRAPLEELLREGRFALADIDVLGAQKLREAYPHNVVRIFVAPPSLSVLEARMRERNEETEEQIARRLKRAAWEMSQADQTEYKVINDVLETSVAQVVEIVGAEMAAREGIRR